MWGRASQSMSSDSTSYQRTINGVLMRSGHGFIAIKNGSITGGSTALEVRVNGTVVWSNGISQTVGTDIKVNFTQARGTDTFLAGDSIEISMTQTGGSLTYNSNEHIGILEIYYDT